MRPAEGQVQRRRPVVPLCPVRRLDRAYRSPRHAERVGHDRAVHGFGDEHLRFLDLGQDVFDRVARVDVVQPGGAAGLQPIDRPPRSASAA